MDVYLSAEARQALRALYQLASGGDGLLLGHMRGRRYFVESVMPLPQRLKLSASQYMRLYDLYPDKLIGFFSYRPSPKIRQHMLAPFATGKILLEIQKQDDGMWNLQAFLVDYQDEFQLLPVPVKGHRKGRS